MICNANSVTNILLWEMEWMNLIMQFAVHPACLFWKPSLQNVGDCFAEQNDWTGSYGMLARFRVQIHWWHIKLKGEQVTVLKTSEVRWVLPELEFHVTW